MITEFEAVKLHHGQEVHHYLAGQLRCRVWRVNGKVKTWKRTPGRFTVPIKYGLCELSNHAYLTESNAVYFGLVPCIHCGEGIQ